MIDYSNLKVEISSWLEKYLTNNGLKGFTIGISGGVDSAVVSTLCAMTKHNLLCLEMPIGNTSKERDRAYNG